MDDGRWAMGEAPCEMETWPRTTGCGLRMMGELVDRDAASTHTESLCTAAACGDDSPEQRSAATLLS